MRSSEGGASLRAERRDGLLTLTMNRPERRNALDAELREALAAAVDQAATDKTVSAVVLTGAGGVFCAGGDLRRFEELHDPRTYRHLSHALTELMEAIESLEKPAIAVLDGVATGVGLTLALSCDWRIATPRARLLFREGRLGLVPTHGGIGRLVKLVGLARATEALLGGDELDAAAALRLGLVSELTEDDPLTAAHRRAELMRQRAPLSFGAAKRLLHLAADSDLRSTILAEGLAQTALLQSDDHREGLNAARERREPVFAGR